MAFNLDVYVNDESDICDSPMTMMLCHSFWGGE